MRKNKKVNDGLAALKKHRKGANLQNSIEKLRDEVNDDTFVQDVVNAYMREVDAKGPR